LAVVRLSPNASMGSYWKDCLVIAFQPPGGEFDR
jgi:hypothetical protein